MQSYEYSVIPAPKRGLKGKGIKGPEAQFANALTKLMNEAAAEGWEYLRAETLPAEERQGLTGRTTVFQNMLVFRRPLAAPEAEFEPVVETPELIAPPKPQEQITKEEPPVSDDEPLKLTTIAAAAAATLRPEDKPEDDDASDADAATEEAEEKEERPTV